MLTGIGSHADALSGQRHARHCKQCKNGCRHNANYENTSKEDEPARLLAGGGRDCVDVLKGSGINANASNGHTDVPSIENNTYTTENVPEKIRTCQNRRSPPNLPTGVARAYTQMGSDTNHHLVNS